MIKEEIITINNKEYLHTTTDKEIYTFNEETKEQELQPCLVQVETGLRYFDAIDEIPCKYHYVEYEEEEIVVW